MSIRLIIACLLLVVLFYFVGAHEVIAALGQVRLEYICYLLLVSAVMIWASAAKWRLFVRSFGHDEHIVHLMVLYTVGYFFNTFTPSYVGGDIARSFHLGRRLDNQRDAFVATFLERFTGLFAMAVLGVTFVMIGSKATAGVEYAILLVGVAAFVGAGICFSESFSRKCFSLSLRILRILGFIKFSEKLDKLLAKISEALCVARKDRALLFKAFLWSLVFHFLTVVNTYIAALAVGWENPDFGGLFVVVPLVLLVSMAPITPSGLGIQEGAFLFLLQRIGADRSVGLGVGLVIRAKVMLIAVIGGLLWLGVRKAERVKS